MDSMKKGRIQKPKAMKKALKVLLPVVSILSFLSYNPSVLQSINPSSLHQFVNRKAMFLFCNAILLFLAKDSGLLDPSCRSDAKEGDHDHDHDHAKEEIYIEVLDGKEEESDGCLELVVVEEKICSSSGSKGGGMEIVGVEGHEDDGVDELNRKCEEFIARVKKERVMEALKLVVV